MKLLSLASLCAVGYSQESCPTLVTMMENQIGNWNLNNVKMDAALNALSEGNIDVFAAIYNQFSQYDYIDDFAWELWQEGTSMLGVSVDTRSMPSKDEIAKNIKLWAQSSNIDFARVLSSMYGDGGLYRIARIVDDYQYRYGVYVELFTSRMWAVFTRIIAEVSTSAHVDPQAGVDLAATRIGCNNPATVHTFKIKVKDRSLTWTDDLKIRGSQAFIEQAEIFCSKWEKNIRARRAYTWIGCNVESFSQAVSRKRSTEAFIEASVRFMSSSINAPTETDFYVHQPAGYTIEEMTYTASSAIKITIGVITAMILVFL